MRDLLSPNTTYENETWLRQQYEKEGKPASRIATECGVHPRTVSRNLARFSIPIRSLGDDKIKMVGKKFNKLTCVQEVEKPEGIIWGCYYLFKCDCGKDHVASGSNVRKGIVRNCKECTPHGSDSPFWKGYGGISRTWWNVHIIKNRGSRNKNYAEKYKVEVTIEQGWELFVSQGRKCALSGQELYFPSRQKLKGTASLDRINSDVGYIMGNVQWVHKDMQYMKNTKLNSDFIRLCKLVAKHNK